MTSRYVDLVALQPDGERYLARCTLQKGETEVRCIGDAEFVVFLEEKGVTDFARVRDHPQARLYPRDGIRFLRALVQRYNGTGIIAKGLKEERDKEEHV